MFYGYVGNILHVDLLTGKTKEESLNAEFARKFIGAMGFGTKILYDEVGPNVDSLSPDNVMVFATGPFTGLVPSCCRTDVTFKSTAGFFGTASSGGFWAPKLKKAGYDAVVVRNRSEKPVYLWIDNDLVGIRDARHIWGKNAWDATDTLREELNESNPYESSIISIGPAGENLVNYACMLFDKYHCGARCGGGAVMGSKNLKAIAVRGKNKLYPASPSRFKDTIIESQKKIFADRIARGRPVPDKYATLASSDRFYKSGCLQGHHYQTTDPPKWMETLSLESILGGNYIVQAPIRENGCDNCPIQCHHMVEIKTGKYAGLRISSGTWVNHLRDWGAKVGIMNYPAIMKCKETLHLLGMDSNSAAETLGFAIELYQRGIITREDTDELELEWGNDDVVIKLLYKIAYREGFGDILADGADKASEKIGRNSKKYAYTIKGLELTETDPRCEELENTWAHGDITNPRGGDNVKTTHSHLKYPEDLKIFEDVLKVNGVSPEIDTSARREKVMLVKLKQDLVTVETALGVCIFGTGNLGPAYWAKLFSSCTGWDMTPSELMITGERIFNLMRAYNVREGITRRDDNYPEYFYEVPIADGPEKGKVLSREIVNIFLDEYYEQRGWNKNSGIPSEEKLIELDLEGS